MKGYYFISPCGSEFLYIDSVLLSYQHVHEKMPHNEFSPMVLKNFNLAKRSGRLSRESLESRGWGFEEIDIHDKLVKDFMNSCFKGRSKRRLNNSATIVFEWAFSHSTIPRDVGLEEKDGTDYNGAPNYSNKQEIVHEGGYKEVLPAENNEDLEKDWWKRG